MVLKKFKRGDTVLIDVDIESIVVNSDDLSFSKAKYISLKNRFIVQNITYNNHYAYRLGSGAWIHTKIEEIKIGRVLLTEKRYK